MDCGHQAAFDKTFKMANTWRESSKMGAVAIIRLCIRLGTDVYIIFFALYFLVVPTHKIPIVNKPLSKTMPSSLRVSRLRKSKIPFSPSRGIKMSQTNYNVMRKKALQQKFDATCRIHLTCELKKGNLVLTFLTAAFESFRTILRNCANHSPFSYFNFEAEIRFLDKTVSAEEACSVKRDSRQLYKINLYLTTSRVNINGDNINIFIDDHFPLIISEMKVHGNFSDLNNILKDSLMNSLKN
jgi:hypothetical protein